MHAIHKSKLMYKLHTENSPIAWPKIQRSTQSQIFFLNNKVASYWCSYILSIASVRPISILCATCCICICMQNVLQNLTVAYSELHSYSHAPVAKTHLVHP